MSRWRYNALMVELPSFGIGVHYTTWNQIEPELHPGDGKNVSDELCKRFDTRWQAQRHLTGHSARIRWETSTKRKRRAELQSGRCWYCGERMELETLGRPRSAEEEHQTPQSWQARGERGVNDGVNIVLACRECNQRKGVLDLRGYRKLLLEQGLFTGGYLLFHGEWQRMATLRFARRSADFKRHSPDGPPQMTSELLAMFLTWTEQSSRVILAFPRELALEVPAVIPEEWLDSLLVRASRPLR